MRALLLSRTIRAVASFAIGAACFGCGQEHTGAPPDQASIGDVPDVIWDIRGTITQASAGSGRSLAAVLVEQPPAISSGSPRDIVNVTRDTKIIRETERGLVKGSPVDLTVGTRVKAWYTAYVQPPFPRQVEARVILVLR